MTCYIPSVALCCLDITTPAKDMGARVSEHLKEVEALPLMPWEDIFNRTIDMMPLFERPVAEQEAEDPDDFPEGETPSKKRKIDSSSDVPFDGVPKQSPPKKIKEKTKDKAIEKPKKPSKEKEAKEPKEPKETKEPKEK